MRDSAGTDVKVDASREVLSLTHQLGLQMERPDRRVQSSALVAANYGLVQVARPLTEIRATMLIIASVHSSLVELVKRCRENGISWERIAIEGMDLVPQYRGGDPRGQQAELDMLARQAFERVATPAAPPNMHLRLRYSCPDCLSWITDLGPGTFVDTLDAGHRSDCPVLTRR